MDAAVPRSSYGRFANTSLKRPQTLASFYYILYKFAGVSAHCYDANMPREHIHFIGIGGIGVSALARFYHTHGAIVSGSDLVRSEITDALKHEGIRIFIGRHTTANIARTVTRVVMTSAVKSDNPELREARQRRIPIQAYAQALADATEGYASIAVAGAHGKSTTTALTALVLIQGGLDPTVIVGTKLREFHPPAGGSNFRLGKSKYFIYEADEYRASFLNYHPTIAVVTNIDREHLDFYKNVRAIESAFLKFLTNLQPRGIAVLNRNDKRLHRIAMRLKRLRPDCRIIWYSRNDPAAAKIQKVLRIPGKHNISNALAAYAVGRTLHIPQSIIYRALGAYRGAWRRFDYQGVLFDAKVFADYAHHPTEIKATLQGTREKFPKSKIWCVFQPHHYERTRDLFPEFVKAFDECDELVLLDIYEVAGRERAAKQSDVSSEYLARAISRRGLPATYISNTTRLRLFLRTRLGEDCVLLMMGAGSIWETTKQLMTSGKGE